MSGAVGSGRGWGGGGGGGGTGGGGGGTGGGGGGTGGGGGGGTGGGGGGGGTGGGNGTGGGGGTGSGGGGGTGGGGGGGTGGGGGGGGYVGGGGGEGIGGGRAGHGRLRVVIAGHVTHDRYGDELVAGGCAFYGARVHAALGADVRLVTGVGEDFACEGELAGIERAVARAGRTTHFANSYPPGGPRVQRIGAQAPPLASGQLPGAWRACDLLHLAPVMEEVDLAAWVRASRARLVGIGVQGWVKTAAAAGAVVQRPWQVDAASLAGVGAACLSEEDLIDQGDLLSRLVAAVPIVVLTRGRAGCEVIARGRTSRVGVHAAREVDPTGAGDAFTAAFLLALASGAPAVDAARLGAAAASIVIEGRGGAALGRVGEARARAWGVMARDVPVRAVSGPGGAP